MNLESLYQLIGIAAFIIGGANFIVVMIAKTFWSLTFKKLEERLAKLEQEVKEHENKNSIIRHDFSNVTKAVYGKMEDLEETLTSAIDKGFEHIKELFNTKIENLDKKINEKNQS